MTQAIKDAALYILGGAAIATAWWLFTTLLFTL